MDSDEDLELLLSFQNGECIPETPPHSPLPHPPESEKSFRSFGMSHMKHTYVANVQRVVCSPRSGKREMVRSAIPKVQKLGYHSDEDLPKPRKSVSMAVFKDVVSSSMEKIVDIKPGLPVRQAMCPANGIDIEKHSGLRIKNRLISCANLSTRLLELRFVRLQAIRTAMMGESMMGAWATVGVLAEKGNPKTSTTGKNFTIWKLSSLDTSTISVFLFGDAYVQHWKESTGSIVVLFNAKARRDEKRNEYILSVFSSDQVMKVGTSVDYSICKGIRKDGTPCTVVVDRRHGNFCQYHNAKRFYRKTDRNTQQSVESSVAEILQRDLQIHLNPEGLK